MARKDWSSSKSGQAHILNCLKNSEGETESKLNTHHDPVMIGQILSMLVERGVITMKINNDAVGPNRRIYTLGEGIKL